MTTKGGGKSMNSLLKKYLARRPVWMIPMIYVGVTMVASFTLPRLEHAYLASYSHSLSVASAQAVLSSIASGMMALTGIVFSLAFVMVQFSATAYSPRLVIWLARDPVLFHSLGVFIATFCYAIAALAWVDRDGSGKVPLFSAMLVVVLLIVSTMLFARLIQRLSDLQITRVLQHIGHRGRQVVRETFSLLDARAAEKVALLSSTADKVQDLPVSQTLHHSGEPKAVASFDVKALVRLATEADAVIVMECAVGDTLVDESPLLRVHGGREPIPEADLHRTVRLEMQRTFEQDPKYPIRLLVDVAIRALSPAINDPTTAVQALDQIEDLLLRLGRRELEAGYAGDEIGALRVVFPTPTWEDYLTLAFDEIRQYGATSVQVMRRLRSALFDLAEAVPVPERRLAVQRYLEHLTLMVERCVADLQDQQMAMQEDRQGLGLSRKRMAKQTG
jgi:uncharacterized membrane protein